MLALSSTCPRKFPAMELRHRKLSARPDPRLEFVGVAGGALIVGVMLVMMFAANSVQSIDSGQDHLSNETLTTSLPLVLNGTEAAEENLDSSGESRGSLKGQPMAKKPTATVTKRQPPPPPRNLTKTQHTKTQKEAETSTATSSKKTKAASLSSRPKQTPTSRRPGPKQTTTKTSKRPGQKSNSTSTTRASRNKRGEWVNESETQMKEDIPKYIFPELRKKDFPCNLDGFQFLKYDLGKRENERGTLWIVTGNIKTGPGDIEQKVLLNFKQIYHRYKLHNDYPIEEIFFDNTISDSNDLRDLKGVDKRGLCPYLDNGKLILDERGFYNGPPSKFVKPDLHTLGHEFFKFAAPVMKKKGYPCKLSTWEDFDIVGVKYIVKDRTIRQAAMGLPTNITYIVTGKIKENAERYVLVNYKEKKWGSHIGARSEFLTKPEKVFYDMSITDKNHLVVIDKDTKTSCD